MTRIGRYLLEKLYKAGVRQLYGIPGDFALNFFRCAEEYGKIKIIPFSHEPSVGFAADGTSRATGKISACAITYGAGGMNMVNPIACAYAEKSPVVVISGAPGMEERKHGYLFHHQAKSLDSQRKVFQEVSVYQCVLEDAETAADQIDTALAMAKAYSQPVYIEIPRDKVFEKMPLKKHSVFQLKNDSDSCAEAAKEIGALLKQSKHPVLMVGIEVHRFGLQKQVVRLAEKLKLPVVSSFMARCTFPLHHKQFMGIYLGPAGPKSVQKLVEKSDCLILLGVPLADTDMASRLMQINPRRVVHCVSRQVKIGHHQYEDVELRSLIESLLKLPISAKTNFKFTTKTKSKTLAVSHFGNQKLQVEDIIHALNFLFEKTGPMPATVDNGDCLFASISLNTDRLLASGYYATMGFAVPAGMGLQIATKERPLILVGDGAFQMTGPEISHCLRYKLNPMVILFNNARWEMLTVIQPKGSYYGLTAWPYAKLAEDWGGKGYVVRTRKELLHAVLDAHGQKCFSLIDARIPAGVRSKTLEHYFGKK